jgi:hypothetical protein
MPKNHNKQVVTSDWSIVEEKVPDQTSASDGGRGRSGFRKIKVGGRKAVTISIPRQLFPELKRATNAAFWDAETLDVPSTGASFYQFFAQITQGNGAQNRTGDVIFVEKLVLRLYVEFSTAEGFVTPVFALVMDKEPAVIEATAAFPAWTDVFQGIGGASSKAYLTAVPNYDKRWRFQYLKRIEMPTAACAVLTTGSAYVAVTQPRCVTLEIPIKKTIKYDSTMGAPYAGAEIYLIGWSDVASNVPKCNGSYEIFFSDA